MSAENTPESENEYAYSPTEEELSLREIDAMQDDVLNRLDQLNSDILSLIDSFQRAMEPGETESQNAGNAKAA